MNRSEAINELAAALAKAQGAIAHAAKDSDNPGYSSKYADLASIWDAIRKPLADNGLSVIQPVAVAGACVEVTTVLMHSSGQWLSSTLTMEAQRQSPDGTWEKIDTPQAIGSVITYARRYALAPMVGVAPEDDDGEGAEGRVVKISPAQARRIMSLMRDAGKKPADVLAVLTRYGFTRIGDVSREKYEQICAEVQSAA
jgi:hypothetical protein